MMKAIAGSMVGGLVAGTIALLASSVTQSSSVDAGRMTSPTSAQVQTTAPQDWGLEHVTFTGAPENGTAAARPVVVRERVVEREVRRAPKRSWGKTALVIGGTSGAGAGIGALIGGKKGALIGAAIGGGSGAIYEVTKRK